MTPFVFYYNGPSAHELREGYNLSLRCASLNVLADAYLKYGNYAHVPPSLLVPGGRTLHLLRLIHDLKADVIGLQEVERPLAAALEATGKWQQFWSPKVSDPDGCLMLVRPNITVTDFVTHRYNDDSDYLMQSMVIGGVTYINTHLKWAPADEPQHPGVAQVEELLGWVGKNRPAVIFTDSNDRPGGPARACLATAGFVNICGNEPTALIGSERAPIDLIAVRGVHGRRIQIDLRPENIPNTACPSDHIPVMAYIETI